jgi:carboxymethylenebutenolidase
MQSVTRRRFLEGSAMGVAVAGVGAPSLGAQDWARKKVDSSPRKHEWVSVQQGNRPVTSFVAYPQGGGKAPAIVVIHEIFGMTDWVESVTDEFAEAGFLAIAPDLLSGMGPNGGRTKDIPADKVGEAVRNLPPDQITADLHAMVDYARKMPSCNGKVCVTGFSWGGSQAFRFATNCKDISAAFVFYGSGPEAADVARIQAPVYGFYGGADARINATIPATTEQMKAAGKFYEPVVYEGAGHGFMRSGAQPNANDADRKARAAAWAKLKELQKNFR